MKQFITIACVVLSLQAYAQSDFTDSLFRDDRWYYCMQPKDIFPKYFYPKEDYTLPIIRYFNRLYQTSGEDTLYRIASTPSITWWSGKGTMKPVYSDTLQYYPQDDFTSTIPLATVYAPAHERTFIINWSWSTIGGIKSGKKTIHSMYYPTMKTLYKYLPKSSAKLGTLYFSMDEE